MENLALIIDHLHPDLEEFWEVSDNSDGEGQYISKWDSEKLGVKPTKEFLLSKGGEVDAYKASIQYKKDRVYDLIGEQLDKLYHDIDEGVFGEEVKISKFYTDNKAIKEAHKKPV